MGLDVYFRRDIANVLRATAAANESAFAMALDGITDPEQERILRSYLDGSRATLVTVGLNFGLVPDGGTGTRQAERGPAAIPAWVETHE